ncbi:hypothetical protein [Kribbella endophytica]
MAKPNTPFCPCCSMRHSNPGSSGAHCTWCINHPKANPRKASKPTKRNRIW